MGHKYIPYFSPPYMHLYTRCTHYKPINMLLSTTILLFNYCCF